MMNQSEYSGQNILDKNLSDVYNLLLQLEDDSWMKGKFGLGSVHWTHKPKDIIYLSSSINPLSINALTII